MLLLSAQNFTGIKEALFFSGKKFKQAQSVFY
jgi:hypothetical protein